MLKAHQECFLLLTKQYHQSGNKHLEKFLAFTYKELLKNFLGGRMSSAAINVRLFQSVFEQNPGFGWQHLFKIILKCIISVKGEESKKKQSGANDDLMPSKPQPKAKKSEEGEEGEGEGSRSNHQRLQAVELLGFLIKECTQHE